MAQKLCFTPENLLNWYAFSHGLQDQRAIAARGVLRMRDRVLALPRDAALKAFFERVAEPCMRALAEDVSQRAGKFQREVSQYYQPKKPVKDKKKALSKKSDKDKKKDLSKKPVKDKEKALSSMIRQCEWIRKLPNDQITFCTPKVLKKCAHSISIVCKREMLLTTIKTHLLTISIFTFILGMMISVIPVGFTALVVPAFYALMATSLISLVGYLYVSTIVEKIVDYKNASIIKTNLVCLSKLFPEE